MQNFHEVAYFADDRQDLLNGINEFLDCSIVIPPSDIEGKDLLKTVADFQKQLLRKRKEREQKKNVPPIGMEQEHKGSVFYANGIMWPNFQLTGNYAFCCVFLL